MRYGLDSLNGIGRTLLLAAAFIGLSAVDAATGKDLLYQKTFSMARSAGQLASSDDAFETIEDPQYFTHHSSAGIPPLQSGFPAYLKTYVTAAFKRLYLAYMAIRAPPPSPA